LMPWKKWSQVLFSFAFRIEQCVLGCSTRSKTKISFQGHLNSNKWLQVCWKGQRLWASDVETCEWPSDSNGIMGSRTRRNVRGCQLY
jgi:hypothetical protein